MPIGVNVKEINDRELALSMFVNAGISHGSANDVIDRWLTTGRVDAISRNPTENVGKLCTDLATVGAPEASTITLVSACGLLRDLSDSGALVRRGS